MSILKENKEAISFLLIFIVLYFGFNSLYGLMVSYYYPASDPFTRWVASQSAWLLSLWEPQVYATPSTVDKFIPLGNGEHTVINVFEGCNGLNVMIVYGSFLVAFRGGAKRLVAFLLLGFLGIHIINLLRIAMLYDVALYFPEHLYFFHKYLFTGVIYLVVFLFWFYWVRVIRHGK